MPHEWVSSPGKGSRAPQLEEQAEEGACRADREENSQGDLGGSGWEGGRVRTAAERTRSLRPEQHWVEHWAGASAQGSEGGTGPARSGHCINT